MLESLFNKVVGRPVKFTKFQRTPILKKVCERMLLTRSNHVIKPIRSFHMFQYNDGALL